MIAIRSIEGYIKHKKKKKEEANYKTWTEQF